MINNEIYYESVVRYSGDVKHVFEYAMEHNCKYYRGVSASGKIYGWKDNNFVEAADGQEWFENPEYHEVDAQAADETIDNVYDEQSKQAAEFSDSDTATEIENVKDAETDKDLSVATARLSELESKFMSLTAKLSELKHAIKVICELARDE